MNQRIICAYGESGAGKSEAIVALILWRLAGWRAAGIDAIARVYVADGSMATYLDTGLVINPPGGEHNPDGIIAVCQYNTYDWPLDPTNWVAEGWFPEGGVAGAAGATGATGATGVAIPLQFSVNNTSGTTTSASGASGAPRHCARRASSRSGPISRGRPGIGAGARRSSFARFR